MSGPSIQSAAVPQMEVAGPKNVAATSLSCQSSTNCLKGGGAAQSQLTAAQKKAAEALYLELELLPRQVGIERLLFITLTFANPVPSRKYREASCLKIRKNLLQKIFSCGVTVSDRSDSDRPHYHIIAVGTEGIDYRTGFDFEAWDASRSAETKWNKSGHTDHATEKQWRAMTAQYTASAAPQLRAVWGILLNAAGKFGFGRINATPVGHPVAYARYLAGCTTGGSRDNHPEDRGLRRVRYWGIFPRRVTLPFHRTTKGANRWRGKVAFCARVLGFDELDDFAKCFGPRWFIYLKGIFRLVPTPVAEASLLTPNLPLGLLAAHRRQLSKIETELLDRLVRYGYQTTRTK